MKRNVAVAILIAIIILLCSMTLSAKADTVFAPFENQLNPTQHFPLSAPLVLGIHLQNSELNQTTRAEIYDLVQNNPGIHFRGICTALGLSIGMVQYHVGILAVAGYVSVHSDGKMQRYFKADKFSVKERKIISLLRHKTSRNILKIINEKKTAAHGDLAAQLSITSQGLTWQIHRLQKAEIIKETNNGLKLSYSIKEDLQPLVNELIDITK